MFGFVASTTSCTPFASTRREQLVDAQVAGLDAVERRQRAAEHVVEAAELVRPLERDDVDGLLDDADQRVVAALVEADPQSSSSVRLPHSRQKRTRSFTSLSAARARSASSFGRWRMWNASRCAVR